MPILQDLEYHIVSDGVSWTDGGGAFGLVPRVIWAKHLPPDEQNRIPLALTSLLIRSEGKTILVDTGYGRKMGDKAQQVAGLVRPEGDLLEGLARLDVLPEQIDIVINTHLHADHCGGNTIEQDDRLAPTFPNAVYYIQRLEWSDAIAPNERTQATYLPANYAPLQESGHLKLINGNTQITRHVRTAVTRGHTRAHQVVILEADGKTLVFMADLATLHYQFQRLAWVTAYDVEPLETIESKRYWQQWALAHDAVLIFQHDTQIPMGKLVADGNRFKVEPVSID
ncbi:MAG: MBL fold metallo-hydrolase [Anaerolineales bacterium]|nr:MBL fold metallo-hydrolase [Anaerolineales bacterium]